MKEIMGMLFDDNNAPDFGTIRRRDINSLGVSSYVLKSADAEKLNLITNAKDGSMATCTDTWDVYVYHMNEWVKAQSKNA